jgi:hypothetical protein
MITRRVFPFFGRITSVASLESVLLIVATFRVPVNVVVGQGAALAPAAACVGRKEDQGTQLVAVSCAMDGDGAVGRALHFLGGQSRDVASAARLRQLILRLITRGLDLSRRDPSVLARISVSAFAQAESRRLAKAGRVDRR